MNSLRLHRPSFYFKYSLFMLFLVFAGFGLNAVMNPGKLPPGTPVVYIHGLIMFIWYILIVIQSGLIRSGNKPLHQKLGKSSVILAIGIIVSGIWMSVAHFARPDGFVFTTINTFILINFIILYYLAWKARFQPEFHKRYMVFVSLSAIFPALGRIILGLNFNEYLAVPFWILLVLVVGVYDFRSLGKIHPATKFGTILILFGIVLTLILIENSVWKEFLERWIG